MRRWWIAGAVALMLGGTGISYALLHNARAREIDELLSIVPGARELSVTQIVTEPSLIHGLSPRRWVFTISKDQARKLKLLCEENKKLFPILDKEREIMGCVASYKHDPSKYRYTTLTLKGQTAIITSSEMSESDYEASLNGYGHK